MLREDRPLKVLAKLNDNAYKIEFPDDNYGSTTFNIVNLAPYFGPKESELRVAG